MSYSCHDKIGMLRRRLRNGIAAVATVGLLVGYSGGLGAPAAYALPGGGGGGDGDPVGCLPDPSVTVNDAVLNGTLHLLDGPLVGFDTRIRMDNASLQLPDPKCDGAFINVPLQPLNFAWSVSGRPSGSTAALSQTTIFTPHLTPDKPGAWQVTFTACPSGCPVNSAKLTIPPITRTLSFNAVRGVEGRINSASLDHTLKDLLVGSRVQISQTGAGQKFGGNTSFIHFGPKAVKAGVPEVLPLDIDPPVEDVPTAVRAVLLASQGPLGVVAGTDIDQVRVRANNVNLDLNKVSKWSASIDGGLNLSLSFDSNHPAVKCEAHYVVRSLFLVTLDEGWSDTLCPDFDLSQMDLSVKLFPTVQNGSAAVAGNQGTTHLVPGSDVRTELVNLFTTATDDLQNGVTSKLHAKLNDPGVKAGLGLMLNGVLKTRFPDLGQIVSMQIVGNELVIRYQSTSGGLTACPPGCVVVASR